MTGQRRARGSRPPSCGDCDALVAELEAELPALLAQLQAELDAILPGLLNPDPCPWCGRPLPDPWAPVGR